MFTSKIQYKLFAAIVLWSSLLVVSLVLAIQWSLGRGIMDYVQQKELDNLKPFAESLALRYQDQGDWEFIKNDPEIFRRLLERYLRNTEFRQPPHRMRPPNHARRHPNDDPQRRPPPHMRERRDRGQSNEDPNRVGSPTPRRDRNESPPEPNVSYILVDQNKQFLSGHYNPDREFNYLPIEINEVIIGFLGVSKRARLATGYELTFIDKQQERLLIFASILLLMTFVITLPLARHLVKPIKSLSQAMSRLSKGQYDSQLTTERKDEFKLLYQNLNNLSATLSANETARQKWFADTAHDLRTPIAIMRGELEAMIDGVRKVDSDSIESIHSETLRLQRFIEELHELARSELGTQHYQKSEINLSDIIDNSCRQLQSLLAEKNIAIETQFPETEVSVFADEFRIQQCMDNLLTNIYKYAENATTAKVVVSTDNQHVTVKVEDNGVGVEQHHLTSLFDHLYRVESSRNRGTGGTGLGLAICKNIIKAHNGSISAEQSSLGGLAIVIQLPGF